jgi:hypothetical protein
MTEEDVSYSAGAEGSDEKREREEKAPVEKEIREEVPFHIPRD